MTELAMTDRRGVLGVLAAGVLAPNVANAFSQQLDDYAYEPQQQATDGRLDLNSAFVVSCRFILVFSNNVEQSLFSHLSHTLLSN